MALELEGAHALEPPRPGLRAAVVIPARDESARIAACLEALALQRDVSPDHFELIVVLDGCEDDTGEVVAQRALECPRPTVHSVTLAHPHGVGRARRLGMDIAWQRLNRIGAEDGLIASTDADTRVARHWLSVQLDLAAAGVAAIGGLIELDIAESEALDPEAIRTRDHALAHRLELVHQGAGDGACEHPHFSGASLALTASAYERCGGLPVRGALEDEALAHALTREGIAIHRSRRVRVTTSARTSGRAPRGLARDLARADWRARRTHDSGEFSLKRLLSAKQHSVALVLPAREVADTIGPIARTAAELQDAGLLDEVLVVDAGSRDATTTVARRSGLQVVQEDELLPELGRALGKGDAMWRGLAATQSDLVVFADTDTEGFHRGFLLGLLGPLLCDPDVQLVKGTFRRPFREGATVLAEGGGRVTELMARPLLNLLAPELTVFEQPLAGETAARRELLERIPFSAGYGVEIAMLIDSWRACGLDSLAQVDLGVRQNRHQSLRDLSAMAYAVLVAAQTRFLGAHFADIHGCGSVVLPPAPHNSNAMENRPVTVEERPPLLEYCRLRDFRCSELEATSPGLS